VVIAIPVATAAAVAGWRVHGWLGVRSGVLFYGAASLTFGYFYVGMIEVALKIAKSRHWVSSGG
jgi:hypothetical protein